MFLNAAMVTIACAAGVSAFALIRGESKWNRLLGLNLVASKVTLIIVLLAVATGNTFYLDIAIVYVLLSFIGTVSLADYIVERNKGDAARKGGLGGRRLPTAPIRRINPETGMIEVVAPRVLPVEIPTVEVPIEAVRVADELA